MSAADPGTAATPAPAPGDPPAPAAGGGAPAAQGGGLPLTPPFEARGLHIGIDLPGASALFSTRRGGVSGGPYATLNLGLTGADGEPRDDPEHVQANRRLLAGQLGLPWERIVRGRQVHGITVHRVDEVPRAALADQGRRPGDGHATALRGVGALVLVADCLPIALAAPGAAAMLHAGWRGLAGGILARGVERLREVASEADPSGDPGAAGYGPATGLVAAIGPGIGGCCYEVGDEVRAAFGALGEDAGRDGRLDLKLIARRQLAELGVAQVHDVGLCTACSDPGLFFSHRRDLGVTGRQCGIVWRT